MVEKSARAARNPSGSAIPMSGDPWDTEAGPDLDADEPKTADPKAIPAREPKHRPLHVDDAAHLGLPPDLAQSLQTALMQAPKDVPSLQLASSLETAGPRTFVYIDNNGKVRSPKRFALMQALSYGSLAAILVGGSVLYASVFGPLGALFGVALGLVVGRNLRDTSKINRAALLSSHDRLDEAELLLQGMLRGRYLGKGQRALCHHNLGAVATRRGDHEEALTQLRAAIRLYQLAWPKSPHLRSCQYGEIIALCNVQRAGEARERLLGLAPRPEGDYLEIKRWMCLLYIQFVAGETPTVDDALWQQSRQALRITSASALLGLCAWAYHTGPGGDRAMARHLLREAYDRLENEQLQEIMPALWKWMEAHRGELKEDEA